MTARLDTTHLKGVRGLLLPDILENDGELVGQHPLVDGLGLGLGLRHGHSQQPDGVDDVVAVEVRRARRRSGTTTS
jgi:hypothetical protein